MDMSAAAIAPRQPGVSAADRAHPLFPLYQQQRSFCSVNLIEASRFCDWLYQYEHEQVVTDARKDEQFPIFLAWMRANQGGARRCPAGDFPHNFRFWQTGGRW